MLLHIYCGFPTSSPSLFRAFFLQLTIKLYELYDGISAAKWPIKSELFVAIFRLFARKTYKSVNEIKISNLLAHDLCFILLSERLYFIFIQPLLPVRLSHPLFTSHVKSFTHFPSLTKSCSYSTGVTHKSSKAESSSKAQYIRFNCGRQHN